MQRPIIIGTRRRTEMPDIRSKQRWDMAKFLDKWISDKLEMIIINKTVRENGIVSEQRKGE